jgi:hypothetical protein
MSEPKYNTLDTETIWKGLPNDVIHKGSFYYLSVSKGRYGTLVEYVSKDSKVLHDTGIVGSSLRTALIAMHRLLVEDNLIQTNLLTLIQQEKG